MTREQRLETILKELVELWAKPFDKQWQKYPKLIDKARAILAEQILSYPYTTYKEKQKS